MHYKTLIQLSLIFLILIISIFFYNQYFKKKSINENVSKYEQTIKKVEEKSSGNIVKDIIYTSEDEKGNIYTIKSEYGEFSNQNSDIIIMSKVSAVIKLNDGSSATLYSMNAKYNITNNDTNFYNDVIFDFLDHKVNADNIDVFFNDSKLEAYNNLVYRNLDLSLIADKVEVNLEENKSKIYMFNNDKVKIYKN